MDTRYREYIDFLTKYRDELSVCLESERDKRRALLDNRLDKLEAALRAQQAETMKLRALETKRVGLQSKLGPPKAKAKELLASVGDGEARESMGALFAQIADVAGQIYEQNRQSLELAAVNLKVLKLFFEGQKAQPQIRFYGPDGAGRKGCQPVAALKETV